LATAGHDGRIRDELSVRGEFQKRVARLRARDVDVAGAIGEDRVLGFRPARDFVALAPGLQQIPRRVEFEDGGRGDAALGRRRVERRVIVGLVQIAGAVQHPDVVVLVDENAGDAAERPITRQGLGPIRVIFVFGRPFRIRRRTHCRGHHTAKRQRRYRRRNDRLA